MWNLSSSVYSWIRCSAHMTIIIGTTNSLPLQGKNTRDQDSNRIWFKLMHFGCTWSNLCRTPVILNETSHGFPHFNHGERKSGQYLKLGQDPFFPISYSKIIPQFQATYVETRVRHSHLMTYTAVTIWKSSDSISNKPPVVTRPWKIQTHTGFFFCKALS